MTLATRVSVFFLGSLAVTLAGFSTALYLLAARHLAERQERQAASALALLTALVEIKDSYVEWEPDQRHIELPSVRWRVYAYSANRLVAASPESFPEESAQGNDWRILRTKVNPTAIHLHSRVQLPCWEGQYLSLTLEVAAPAGADNASLRQLGWTLAGLSLGMWCAAALAGRWLCARTLAPVARMAESARSIQPGKRGDRLPVASTGDELQELGTSFNGLLDRLQEAIERERRFTGEASHQLRTPLAVMLGQVEVALRRDRPGEEYRRVLDIVADQGRRLQRAVEMLLFLARTQADAGSPSRTPLTLRPWLADQLTGWATHPRAADLQLTEGGERLTVLAHAALLGQAVDVLIDNALKYSIPGSPIVLSVRPASRRSSGTAIGETSVPPSVELVVEDHGSGIQSDDLPRIFEPFFRSPRQRGSEGGVGLGLSIALRAVEAMGGRIAVESEPGRGSRFVVQLGVPDEDFVSGQGGG
jgi:two-component system, OmpR family, sensor kinase